MLGRRLVVFVKFCNKSLESRVPFSSISSEYVIPAVCQTRAARHPFPSVTDSSQD